MKKTLLLIGFLLLSILITSVFAQDTKYPDILNSIKSPEVYLLSNTAMGKEFWVAIPQNEVANSGIQTRGVEIVVTSPFTTDVTLEIPEAGYIRTKKVEAFKQTTFSSEDNEVTYGMEVTESETVTKKGIKLSADKPFFAWVINSKQYSADGYMAIPTAHLGKEYHHSSFYDDYNNTQWDRNKRRGGGFIVVGTEPATSVTINLAGFALAGQTVMGKKPGDRITVTLNEGETYMVRGDGSTSGQFDLTGTKITANKPIGVISFHMRTKLPNILQQSLSMDNLCEMMAPVNTWGKSFNSVQFDRKQVGNRKGLGDYFRIINNQSQTKFTCEFYSIVSYEKAGTRAFTINNANSFAELDPISDIPNNNTKTSIHGMATWTTDKPIQLLQYAFSNTWDGDSKWGPVMMIVPPIEQYVRNFVLSTPQKSGFQEHQLTLIAQGDPSDPESKLLRTIKVNGNDLWRSYPAIMQNRIPNTDFYWVRLNLTTGAHTIQSNTLLTGYLIGFDSYSAYGYPAVHGFNQLTNMDTAAPVITKVMSCGNYTLEALETTNGRTGDNPRQVDAGLSQIVMFSNESFNYDFSLKNPQNFKPQNGIVKQEFYLNLIDPSKPAKALFAVLDRAGNVTVDSVSYDPPNVTISPTAINYDKVVLKNSLSKTVSIKNLSANNYLVKTITNKNPKYVIQNLPTLPLTLASGDSIMITVTYTPTLQSPEITDIDTISVSSDCLSLKVGLSGKVIYPTISVLKSFDFGKVLQGEQVCLEERNSKGLTIKNTGTSDLTVTSVHGVKTPFIISSPTVPLLPVTIEPGKEIDFKSICFIPQDTITSELTLTVGSNAVAGDSTFAISGRGYIIVDTTSVNEFDNEVFFSLSPNPANDSYTLKWNVINPMKLDIQIYDINGILVENHPIGLANPEGTLILSTAKLNTGIYTVRLTNGTHSIIRKLVILK